MQVFIKEVNPGDEADFDSQDMSKPDKRRYI